MTAKCVQAFKQLAKLVPDTHKVGKDLEYCCLNASV